MSKIKFADPAHHIAFTEYRLGVHVRTKRVERLVAALRAEVRSWRGLLVVHALMTLRGNDVLSALTFVGR
jgi:hypothetical protein